MKLLYVLPEYLPQTGGGLITFYRWLLPELVRGGHQVTVLVGSGVSGGDFEGEIEGVTVRYLSLDRFAALRSGFTAFEALPELRRHLAAARALWELAGGGAGFDLVETTDWGLLALPWLGATDRPPLVAQLHGSIGQIDLHDPQRGQGLQGCIARLLESSALPCADELQTYSEANSAYWQAACGRAARVIHPALALGAAGSGERSGGVVVGRIQKWKGAETLCAALGELGAAAPSIAWIGRDTVDGAAGGSYMRSLARRFPGVWGRALRPIGALPPSEVGERQRRAAFVVAPSTWDVFNFTIVEAMAAAAPVVVSTGAGASELVEDGRNGFTFPAGDASALAAALRRVVSQSAAERSAIGAAGRETVERELAPKRIAELRLARYEALLEKARSHSPPGWLRELVTPGAPGAEGLDFLHQLPLSGILRHASRRALAKARGR